MTSIQEKVAAVPYKDIFESSTITENIQMIYSEDMIIDKENFYIDIKKLIEENGIEIIYKELGDEESGQFIKEANIIIVNKNHSENRQRFTLAHEFAHYLLEHESSHRSMVAENYDNYKLLSNEREANDLAANLIMPEIMMITLYEKYLELNNLSKRTTLNNRQKDELYNYISGKLKVSKSAVGFRLINLGLI